ncbi:MAG: tetratricopeptide repeat protein [Dehalococcoidia bacterium]
MSSEKALTCTQYAPYIFDYIEGALDQEQKLSVASHLSRCTDCLQLLATLKQKQADYTDARPIGGILTLDLADRSVIDDIVQYLLHNEAQQKHIGLCNMLISAQWQLRSLWLLQGRLYNELRRQGKKAMMISPVVLPEIMTEGIESSECEYILIYNIGHFPDCWEAIQELSAAGINVVASISENDLQLGEELSQGVVTANCHIISFANRDPATVYATEQNRFNQYLNQRKSALINELNQRPDIKELVAYLYLFDTLGIAAPASLLARILKTDENEIIMSLDGTTSLAYRIRKKPPVFYCTENELVANAMRHELIKDADRENKYKGIIAAAGPQNRDESFTVMMLFHMLERRGERILARNLYKDNQEQIENLWKELGARELVSWGITLRDLCLYEGAKNVLRKGIEKQPENIYLRHALATVMERQRKYPEAEAEFRQGYDIDPDNIFLLQAWGDMERKRSVQSRTEDRRSEALGLFQKAQSIDPENLHVLVSLGNLEAETGDHRTATDYFDRALEIDRYNLYALHSRGELFRRQRKWAEAASDYEKVIEIMPKNVPAHHALGQIDLERGHFKKAMERFHKRIYKIDRESKYTLHSIGNLYIELADITGNDNYMSNAFNYLERARQVDQENIETYTSLAKLERKQGNYTAALENLNLAENRDPENLYVKLGRVEVLKAQRDMDRVTELAYQVLDDNPKNVVAMVLYAKLRAESGFYDEARRLLKDARTMDPGNLRIYNDWGEMEASVGNYEKAVEILGDALDIDDENSYVNLKYSEILKRLGNFDEAEEYHKKAGNLMGLDSL